MPASVHRTWTSSAPPEELLARLQARTEPLTGGFKLMYRLSGAGVVVRTLEAPETDRPLFGKIDGDRFSISVVPSPRDVTPFHPIIRGTVAEADGGGSRLEAELAHHPNARTFAPLYAFGALALGVGTLLGARDQPAMLAGGLGMAVLFAVFPTLQARARFDQAVRGAEALLVDQLQLQSAP